jgi:protease-4
MSKLFFSTVIFVFLTGCLSQPSLFPSVGPLEETKLEGSGDDKILVIEVSGLLSSAKPSGFIDRLVDRPSLTTRIKEELTKAVEDEDLKAIVLRINSPGGTVTASDIVYHEIREFKKKRNIPIVASIMDLGTSGGYYVAVAADKIVAHPSTVTGSVGVIMVSLNGQGLLEKIGVKATTIASGPKKSMGSPFRTMTDEERAIFQNIIDSMYDQFVTVVDDGRPKLDKGEVRRLADGRIYSALQAEEVGLVDEVGYLEDAIRLAKKEAGIEEASVVTYHRAGGYKPNIYSSFASGSVYLKGLPSFDPPSLMTLLNGGTPQFMYLWMP